MSGNLIRVECPVCSNVWIPAANVTLTLYPGGCMYAFVCKCGIRHSKNCSQRIADLMRDIVRVQEIELEEHTGPPLTHDDALDFHLALQEPDWISELA